MTTSSDRAPSASRILAINGGSSSVKFALFQRDSLRQELRGRLEGIGQRRTELVVRRSEDAPPERIGIEGSDRERIPARLAEWLEERSLLRDLAGIGHRIVHGGVDLVEHQRVTPALVKTLNDNLALDPAHLPQEIALIAAVSRKAPGVAQVACFDTAFHRDLPRVAQLLPIPREYLDAGVRRLGFHGLSYTYLLDELRRVAGDTAADGRVILAHLGSGASLAATRGGRPVDTTMAFTPAAGLVMGTRPGDLDPGVIVYLMRAERASADRLDSLINERCGLRGVSGTTSSMEELLARRSTDPCAAEAVELFCYQVVKWIGAFAAALGGLDTIVFSGGIGERSAVIRREICSRLQSLNVALDDSPNEAHAAVISAAQSAVVIRVIPTDEEIVIARTVRKILEEP
jgi:acetate kinase